MAQTNLKNIQSPRLGNVTLRVPTTFTVGGGERIVIRAGRAKVYAGGALIRELRDCEYVVPANSKYKEIIVDPISDVHLISGNAGVRGTAACRYFLSTASGAAPSAISIYHSDFNGGGTAGVAVRDVEYERMHDLIVDTSVIPSDGTLPTATVTSDMWEWQDGVSIVQDRRPLNYEPLDVAFGAISEAYFLYTVMALEYSPFDGFRRICVEFTNVANTPRPVVRAMFQLPPENPMAGAKTLVSFGIEMLSNVTNIRVTAVYPPFNLNGTWINGTYHVFASRLSRIVGSQRALSNPVALTTITEV